MSARPIKRWEAAIKQPIRLIMLAIGVPTAEYFSWSSLYRKLGVAAEALINLFEVVGWYSYWHKSKVAGFEGGARRSGALMAARLLAIADSLASSDLSLWFALAGLIIQQWSRVTIASERHIRPFSCLVISPYRFSSGRLMCSGRIGRSSRLQFIPPITSTNASQFPSSAAFVASNKTDWSTSSADILRSSRHTVTLGIPIGWNWRIFQVDAQAFTLCALVFASLPYRSSSMPWPSMPLL